MSEMRDFIRKAQAAEQGSAAWLYERVGHVTASRFCDVIAKRKDGKPTAERKKYMMELVIERITGQPSDHWTSAAMMWGTQQESASRMAFEAGTGKILEPVGFVKHKTLSMVGASPDGLIDDDGGFESKSPFNTANHIYTILDGMPEEHMAQCQGGMWICQRSYWMFQSYDPRLPEPLCRYVKRIERDESYIAAMEKEIIAFSAEVAAMVGRLGVHAELVGAGTSSMPQAFPPAVASGDHLADRMNP